MWAALSGDDHRRLGVSLATAQVDARALHGRWTGLAGAVRERLRLAAEQAEQDRIAREERARAAAAEQAARQAAEREAEQRRLAAAPPAVTEPAAAGRSGGGAGGGSGCDPNYAPCVPVSAADLDCDDLPGGPYTVLGSDPHRLDNDDPDSLGCEGR